MRVDRPHRLSRRDLLRLGGVAGVVLVSSLVPSPGMLFAEDDVQRGEASDPDVDEFYFLQLSDTHIGFSGPKINPEADTTLAKAVDEINALAHQPDFIVFTGDLTHTTDEDAVRRQRMQQFKDIIAKLKVQKHYFLPGEHDAAPDQGAAFSAVFGDMHWSFDHKGVHFIALDNVSDPGAIIGEKQIAWLADDLKKQKQDARIVVFTHRPLFDLAPQWDWATRDAKAAIDLLLPFANVTVFYGHIHQEHLATTGHIEHHAAKGLMYALPAPGSVPKKAPVAWDPAKPFANLGFRELEADVPKAKVTITEHPLAD
jgi:predicted phosphodiesterase